MSSKIARFAILSVLLGCTSLAAQDAVLPDPTTESPAIRSQMDAVRGVEKLDELNRQIAQLIRQNSDLLRRLEETNQRTKVLEAELTELRSQQEADSERKQTLPPIRLVAVAKTELATRIELEVGSQVIRVSEGVPFDLPLDGGLTATAEVQSSVSGDVSMVIEELDVRRLLAFRPSGSSPSVRTRRASTSD